MFISRSIDYSLRSPLALLVAWIHLADHEPFSFPLDDPAMLATFFDR
jgi:hypothetical protein